MSRKKKFLLRPWSEDDPAQPHKIVVENQTDGIYMEIFDKDVSVGQFKLEIDKGLPRLLIYVDGKASEEPLLSVHISPDHLNVDLPATRQPSFTVHPRASDT